MLKAVSLLAFAAVLSAGASAPAKAPVDYVKANGQLGPGQGTIVITIEAPPQAELTKDAPLVVDASGEGLHFPKQIKTHLDPSRLPIRLPVVVDDGATGPARIDLEYYWCSHGKKASCNPEHAHLLVAIDLGGDGPGGEAYFTHTPQSK